MPRPSPEPRGACGRTSAAGTTPTAGRPRPARRRGSAGCRGRSRWPSRSAGVRSFSSAFITIQSSSPRTSRVSRAGSVLRCAEIDARRLSDSLSRVLGFGRLLLADPPQDLGDRPPRAAAPAPAASCRSAARRAARPASRCRSGCRCPAPTHLGLLGAHVLERADDRRRTG